MSKISEIIHDIHYLDSLAYHKTILTRIHPLAKVIVTFWYLILLMSYDKYNLGGVLSMSFYLIFLWNLGNVPLRRAFKHLNKIIVVISLVGIANPFIDRVVMMRIGSILITGGVISFLTLIMKGSFALLSSYLLIATTSMESICYALRLLHIPKILVTVIMLIYRYITLFLKETDKIILAYSLRAPRQKGIYYKAWGTLVGQMMLKSIDRAEMVYESMSLRGFKGEFYLGKQYTTKENINSYIYTVSICLFLVIFRVTPVFELIEKIII